MRRCWYHYTVSYMQPPKTVRISPLWEWPFPVEVASAMAVPDLPGCPSRDTTPVPTTTTHPSVLITFLLLCQHIVVKAIDRRKFFLSWKLSWVDGVLSFLLYLVRQWQKTPRFSFKWQTWQLEQEAGSTHLQPQARSRESELKATQSYKLSKPASSDIFPSTR